MKRLDWFIARRYLASRHKGRFLSLITVIAIGGVLLGVMALITVIGVMTGLQRDLQDKIIGSNPHLYVFETGPSSFRMNNWPGVLDSIGRMPGVVAMQPFVMTKVAVVGNGMAQSGVLHGLRFDSTGKPINLIEEKIRAHQYRLGPTQSGKPPIVLGWRLAEALTAVRGDVLTVLSLENVKLNMGPLGEINPKFVQFEVTDIFTTGMFEYDDEFMYTTLRPAQELVSMDSTQVSGVAINVADPWAVEGVRRRVDERLGFAYNTQDWKMLSGALFHALKLEKLAMVVILFLIVIVAAFNIISTLIMVVADKTREIGILKSMGMTAGGVLRIFVLQGLTIGLVGTTLGTLGGIGLVWLLDTYKFIELPGDVYFVDSLPVSLDMSDLVLIIATSIVIGFAATIYPARQAAQLLPVEAIRHE